MAEHDMDSEDLRAASLETGILTEDGVVLQPGDRAYNYYDMKPGSIGGSIDHDGWFEFEHDDNTRTTLNGQRICSEAYARSRGWLPR